MGTIHDPVTVVFAPKMTHVIFPIRKRYTLPTVVWEEPAFLPLVAIATLDAEHSKEKLWKLNI